MLTVEEALAKVASQVAPLAARRVTLAEAAGLVLADDVTSDVNSPPHDKSMMDGYAVRSSDRQPERQIVEEVPAGAVPRHAVTPGTAVRIMTGAPIPEGADAVVPLEETELLDESTVLLHTVHPACGQHVLPLGASLRAGDIVLRRGALIRPIEIAILAEVGQAVVRVQPPPRVAVLPTGSEIVPAGERPAPGQIRNSNGPMLLAAAERAGADTVDLGIARDDHDSLLRSIETGLACDILVLSGGVSAGTFDLVPRVLAAAGVAEVFHKVALRPGKPLWFGVQRRAEHCVLVFGLPGNPVSSLVCFELFVRPAIAALAGRGFAGLPTISARLLHPYDHAGGRAACLPAQLTPARDPDLHHGNVPPSRGRLADGHSLPAIEILPWQGSADLAALARANALVRLPRESVQLAAGAILDALMV